MAKTYEREIAFYVRSKENFVKLTGEGVPLSIDLEDQRDRCVNFASVVAEKSVSKRVRVVNNSRTSVCIIFDLLDRLPLFSRPKRVLEPEYEIEEKKSKVVVK